MKFFDSHTHYYDKRFTDEYPGGIDGAIADSMRAGMCGFLCAGTNPDTTKASIALAGKYENAYASAGLHPQDTAAYTSTQIPAVLSEIEQLLTHPKVAALGEIGLDYHWDPDRAVQKEAFDAQLSLAESAGIPVIIHDRDAHGDTMDIILAHKNVTGVIHSYSGSVEMAKEYVRMGWYLSFSGPLTYKNAEKVRTACKAVPVDRLLIETDCPYLPPVPHRGKINTSALMLYTMETMAECTGLPIDAVAAQTMENACALFRIRLL